MRARLAASAGLVAAALAAAIAARARAQDLPDLDRRWHDGGPVKQVARADEQPPRPPPVDPLRTRKKLFFNYEPCILIPHPTCAVTPFLELGLSGGESYGYIGKQWLFRGFAEVGVLVAARRNPRFHWGPVVDVGFDVGRVTSGFSVSPKLRGRYWVGGSEYSLFTLDGAIGPSFERATFNGGLATDNRAGAAADVGFLYHGVLGLFAGGFVLADPRGVAGREVRVVAGVRGTLVGWLVALAPIGYGLSASGWRRF